MGNLFLFGVKMDFTLVTCSYNTPEVTLTMLKSFVTVYSVEKNFPIILMENSTNEQTVELLVESGVPFIRNVGAKHERTMDIALKKCKTKYALVVDTDVLFNRPNDSYFQENSLVGEVCGDRGGLKLFPRVHPWYMLVDMEFANRNDVSFYDEKRLGIVDCSVCGDVDRSGRIYDVGASFYEDYAKIGKVVDTKNDKNFMDSFHHYEGMSWRGSCDDIELQKMNSKNYEKFAIDSLKYKDVSLVGKFAML